MDAGYDTSWGSNLLRPRCRNHHGHRTHHSNNGAETLLYSYVRRCQSDSPMLRFRIAFSLIGHGPSASIQLWQVDLKLQSATYCRINRDPHCFFPQTSHPDVEIHLLGPTLAFKYNRGNMCICVMDWQRATNNPPDYACRIDNPKIVSPLSVVTAGYEIFSLMPAGLARFIRRNRLLGQCAWLNGANVFDWSRFEARNGMPIQPGPVGSPLKGNLFDDPQRTPQWCFDEHTSQYVYSEGRSLYRFAVKDAHSESSVSHTPVQLVDGHGEFIIDAHAVGRTCAAAVTIDGEVRLTCHGLSGEYLEYGIRKARPSSLHHCILDR